jgi:uncharacterized protein YecT (DUF1311 family)
MIRLPLLLPLLLLALLPVAASATSPGKACDDARTQLDINECAAREADASDAELNAVYRQVMQKLRGQPVAIDKLRNAQRLWIQLRDADIQARYPVGKDENPRPVRLDVPGAVLGQQGRAHPAAHPAAARHLP